METVGEWVWEVEEERTGGSGEVGEEDRGWGGRWVRAELVAAAPTVMKRLMRSCQRLGDGRGARDSVETHTPTHTHTHTHTLYT